MLSKFEDVMKMFKKLMDAHYSVRINQQLIYSIIIKPLKPVGGNTKHVCLCVSNALTCIPEESKCTLSHADMGSALGHRSQASPHRALLHPQI